MTRVAFFDTKPYDRKYFETAPGRKHLIWSFHEFRLTAETAAVAAGQDAVCVFVNDRIDRSCLEVLANVGVKHVWLRCAGYNNVDIPATVDLGITVTRVPSYSPHAVAEHAVALLLTLNRRIHRAHNRVREQNFSLSGLVGFDVHGKTVGIITTGKIGRLAAQIFRGFGAEVLAYDLLQHGDWATTNGVNYTDLCALLENSDIISLHLPLTPESYHLINDETLDRMKRGAYLVNTSRGKLIDTGALISHLKSGRMGGVVLDVYEEEEGVFFEDLSETVLADDELSRLLMFPNVLITSHQAFLTHEALYEIALVTTENLTRLDPDVDFLEDTVVR